jgi:hypothetical protein
LDWVTDARIKAECIAAESRAESLISDSDDSVLWFSDYGTDWIKSIVTSEFHRPLSDADLDLLEPPRAANSQPILDTFPFWVISQFG